MDYSVIGIILKTVLLLVVWSMCARMFYKNVTMDPPEERSFDDTTAAFLSCLWPLLIPGLWFAVIVKTALWIGQSSLKLYRTLST